MHRQEDEQNNGSNTADDSDCYDSPGELFRYEGSYERRSHPKRQEQ